jgi:hypothetical protein
MIAKQSHNYKHLRFLDQTKFLASTPFYSSRIIREVLEIEKRPQNFNCEYGYKLRQYWKTIIHHFVTKNIHTSYLPPLIPLSSPNLFLFFILNFPPSFHTRLHSLHHLFNNFTFTFQLHYISIMDLSVHFNHSNLFTPFFTTTIFYHHL